MLDKLNFTKVRKYLKLAKNSGSTHVYLIVNGENPKKAYIPCHGTIPLGSCVVDNTVNKYVIFSNEVKFLKTFDFVISIEDFGFIPIPDKYIEQSLDEAEKVALKDCMDANQGQFYTFFQVIKQHE